MCVLAHWALAICGLQVCLSASLTADSDVVRYSLSTPDPKMARTRKVVELAAIEARREALRAELAHLDEQAKAVEQAARDAGRSTLLAALDRVKIAGLSKSEARAIANSIGQHGGKAVADLLGSLA